MAAFLFISPSLAEPVSDREENYLHARVHINDWYRDVRFPHSGTITQTIDSQIAVRYMAVSSDKIYCFLRKSDRADASATWDGKGSFVSPLVSRGTPLTLLPTHEQHWDLLTCIPIIHQHEILFLMEGNQAGLGAFSIEAAASDQYGETELIFKGDRVRDVTRVALLKAPDPSTVCAVGAFGKMPATIRVGQSYSDPVGISAVKYYMCQRDPDYLSLSSGFPQRDG